MIPVAAVTKPFGAACNLDCAYCYFLSKEALHPDKPQVMDEALLRQYLVNYLRSNPDGPVFIHWQGGEPTLRGLEFYQLAQAITDEFARPGQQVQHTIQTNATLVDAEWADFFASKGWLVGVSIDGPAEFHNAYRVNRAGRGSFDRVMRGWRILQDAGVDVNVLCTVNSANVGAPLEVYRFFRDTLGAKFLQFIPIVERVEAGQEDLAERSWRGEDGTHVVYRQRGTAVTSRTVAPEAWGNFLCAVFDEWLVRDVGEVFVQHFDGMLGARLGKYTTCVHAPECGTNLEVDPSGMAYACDHFVEPGYALGNVAAMDLSEMVQLPRQVRFGRSKLTELSAKCVSCPVRWACHGGCLKDRFTGEDGRLNYLCAGYYRFFCHAAPAIESMARKIR